MTAVDRYSDDNIKRLLASLNSITFRDEDGTIEYFGQKVVMIRSDAFLLMKKEMAARNAAGTLTVILGIVGRRVGSEEAKAVMSQGGFHDKTNVESLSGLIRKAVEKTNMGYGKALVQEMDLESKTAKIFFRNSFEAESVEKTDTSCCFFVLGYLEGLLSELLSTQIRGTEPSCAGRGDQSCVFELGPTFTKSRWKI